MILINSEIKFSKVVDMNLHTTEIFVLHELCVILLIEILKFFISLLSP